LNPTRRLPGVEGSPAPTDRNARNTRASDPKERFMQTPLNTRRLWLGLALVIAPLVGAALPGCVFVSEREVRYVDDDYAAGSSQTPRGRLGVYIAGTSASLAAQTGADRKRSCVLERVIAGSPADQAGLRPYDVVTHIDGREYASPSALREAIRGRRPGEALELTIVRGGEPLNVSVNMGPGDHHSDGE
jgi:membrane-associated protease RseP (regulator of RpoE activity)